MKIQLLYILLLIDCKDTDASFSFLDNLRFQIDRPPFCFHCVVRLLVSVVTLQSNGGPTASIYQPCVRFHRRFTEFNHGRLYSKHQPSWSALSVETVERKRDRLPLVAV